MKVMTVYLNDASSDEDYYPWLEIIKILHYNESDQLYKTKEIWKIYLNKRGFYLCSFQNVSSIKRKSGIWKKRLHD